jgi:hypothetical protein
MFGLIPMWTKQQSRKLGPIAELGLLLKAFSRWLE